MARPQSFTDLPPFILPVIRIDLSNLAAHPRLLASIAGFIETAQGHNMLHDTAVERSEGIVALGIRASADELEMHLRQAQESWDRAYDAYKYWEQYGVPPTGVTVEYLAGWAAENELPPGLSVTSQTVEMDLGNISAHSRSEAHG